MRLPPLMAPQVNLSITYESGVEFQMEANKLPSGFHFSDHANFDDFTLFCRGRLRNVHSLKRTCQAIVLLIISFVLPCPRFRRRRCFFKVPIKNNNDKKKKPSFTYLLTASPCGTTI